VERDPILPRPRAARRAVAAVTAEALPAEDIAVGHRGAAIVAATPVARRAVAAVTAEALRVADIAAGHRGAAILVATPEVVRAVGRQAEALRLQAGILRQETTAVDSSRNRHEAGFLSPSGGSERSLLLLQKGEAMARENFFRAQVFYTWSLSTNRKQDLLTDTLSAVRELK
jgi:hypothetical protein